MNWPWIEVVKRPYEEDMRHCEVAASDGCMATRQEFYAGISDLRDFGARLQAFPRDRKDEVLFEAGKKDDSWAHWVRLRVYLYDFAGHGALQVDTMNNGAEAWRQEAHFTIRCEVASLNRLGKELAHWTETDESRLRVELTPVEGRASRTTTGCS